MVAENGKTNNKWRLTMTLDIPQFIQNSIRTQSKIHHLDINVKATEVDKIPASVKKLITDDYGEKYLDDSDYVAFFWGPVNKDNIDKLFNTVDKALGKSANKLTDKDFKKIKMSNSDESSADDSEEDVSDENAEDTKDIESDVEDTSDEDTEENSDGEEEEEEELNEDDEEIDIEVDADNAVNEKPSIPTSYFFLKITSK